MEKAGARSWVPAAVAGAVVFLVAFALLVPLFFSFPVLWDTDSYYHLAAARGSAPPGPLDGLPWVRYSLFADGFGDKEPLFHLALVPFASGDDPAAGGRWALAAFDAALLALLAVLAVRAVGGWGAALPLVLVLTSAEWIWRGVRLRPELLSLGLLLVAVWLAGRGAYRRLGVVAAVYALAYTAFQALLGLCALLFLFRGWVRRRWEWPLLLYPVAGVGLALLVHPQFPENLVVWWVQNVDFYRFKGVLDVGSEIGPQAVDEVLLNSLGWWLALVAVWRSGRSNAASGAGEGGALGKADAKASVEEPAAMTARADKHPATWQGPADAFSLAAVVFGALYLLARRFVVYFVPFASLALLFELCRRGRRPGGWTLLPGRGRLPLAVALAVCAAATLPQGVGLARVLAGEPGAGREREAEWRELAAAVPTGAKVAATWGSAEVYALFAPQGRYLNVLDPIFMALPYPAAYRAQRAIFTGEEPDVPYAVVAALDSEYIAYSTLVESPRLGQRLRADPRVEILYDRLDLLARFRPPPRAAAADSTARSTAESPFLLDWEAEVAPDRWVAYPRDPEPARAAIEGYVDLTRLGVDARCLRLRHRFETVEPSAEELELAPYGPAALTVDGETRLDTGGEPGAILGSGFRVPVSWTAGEHRLEVATCRAGNGRGGRWGFYLLRGGSHASAAP